MPLTIQERLRRLEEAAEGKGKVASAPRSPHQPCDYTKHLRLPASAMQDLVRAVPNAQAIANDHIGRPVSLPGVHGRSRGKAGENYGPAVPPKVYGQENWPRKKKEA